MGTEELSNTSDLDYIKIFEHPEITPYFYCKKVKGSGNKEMWNLFKKELPPLLNMKYVIWGVGLILGFYIFSFF